MWIYLSTSFWAHESQVSKSQRKQLNLTKEAELAFFSNPPNNWQFHQSSATNILAKSQRFILYLQAKLDNFMCSTKSKCWWEILDVYLSTLYIPDRFDKNGHSWSRSCKTFVEITNTSFECKTYDKDEN